MGFRHALRVKGVDLRVSSSNSARLRLTAVTCSEVVIFLSAKQIKFFLKITHLHCVSKKFPPLNSLSLWQILTDFQKFCTAEKRIKFATKTAQHYPPHLRNVATLPWEINNSKFLQIFSRYGRKCKQVAFLSSLTLLLIHKF